jgi:sigma-54 specific flagellar transcriptional regulator A
VHEPLVLRDAEDTGDEEDEASEASSASCESLDGDPAVESALKNGGINLKDHLSAIEIGLIRKALEEADGTVAEAARLLNMRRTTLVEKLRKYRLYA